MMYFFVAARAVPAANNMVARTVENFMADGCVCRVMCLQVDARCDSVASVGIVA